MLLINKEKGRCARRKNKYEIKTVAPYNNRKYYQIFTKLPVRMLYIFFIPYQAIRGCQIGVQNIGISVRKIKNMELTVKEKENTYCFNV